MATIALYAGKINNMPSLINDVKISVSEFKADLLNLKNNSLSINKNICNLDDVVSSISSSTQIQEEKINTLNKLEQDIQQFAYDVARIDSNVADLINKYKDNFYNQYSYLKPESEKNGWEKFCDGCKKVSQWCKEHWVMVVTVIAVIAIAVIAVVTFGVAIAAIAAIAGIISMALCVADAICMIATGGKSISDLCRENGMNWLGEIFDGISLGCDIVSIILPAGAAIKTMAKMGVKSVLKGTYEAASTIYLKLTKDAFKKGFKNGVKSLGKVIFKTFIFDIDDFTKIGSNGKRVFDIFDSSTPIDIVKFEPNEGGIMPDGSYVWPDNDGFLGEISNITLEPGTKVDRYGSFTGTYVAPEGIPIENRALKPGTEKGGYAIFKINKPINVQSGRIAPWFGQPGGGIQYQFYKKIKDLIGDGFINVIDYPKITLKGLIRFGEQEYLSSNFQGG